MSTQSPSIPKLKPPGSGIEPETALEEQKLPGIEANDQRGRASSSGPISDSEAEQLGGIEIRSLTPEEPSESHARSTQSTQSRAEAQPRALLENVQQSQQNTEDDRLSISTSTTEHPGQARDEGEADSIGSIPSPSPSELELSEGVVSLVTPGRLGLFHSPVVATSFGTIAGMNINFHTGATITQGSNIRPLIQDMKRSRNAEYNVTENVARGPCTPGTRLKLLQYLDRWCKLDPGLLYWLSGIAGTGKTAVAYSCSQHLDRENRLGASFFCSRSLPDCRDINLILPTIAHQLAMRYPPFERVLVEVLERDPDIFRKSLDTQLNQLIIAPWHSSVQYLPHDLVVVLDALDECEHGQASFLKVIFDNVDKLPFKLLITSRPDYSIRDIMKTRNPEILSTFILHEVEKDLVEADIARYLADKLSGRVPPDVIDKIRDLSGLLFIVAATLARFFAGINLNARTRLESFKMSSRVQGMVLAPLDECYMGALHSSLEGGDLLDEEVQGVKDVLYMIVCAQNPPTRECLAGLLNISGVEVDHRLDSLGSIIPVPEDRSRPITIFHSSFADFIQDVSRSGRYSCHPDTFHLKITQCCLSVLNDQLRKNLSGPVGRTLASGDWIGPQSHISPSLRYAAVYWVEHLALSDSSSRETVFSTTHNLLVSHALHWIECLSCLQMLPNGVQSLENLLSMAKEGDALAVITYEYLRFLQYFYSFIESNSTNVYLILPWIPSGSPINDPALGSQPDAPRVTCGLPANWPALERILDIHSATVNSIAISQDGSRMASGSDDNTVKIWNIGHHNEENVFVDHANQVNSVAITRDGSRTASGSSDATVRVRDTATNRVVLTLKASSPVFSVAISSNEQHLAAGDEKGAIDIFDLTSGQILRKLDGHNDNIRSLSFIPNTLDLISGSDDRTARLWNVLTGEIILTLFGHTNQVCSVACSPGGDKLITGSKDSTARLWNTSGQELQVLQGHSGSVNAVIFMLDGKGVITGSDDCTLRVWNENTGRVQHILTATGPIRSIALFPDQLRVATCSANHINIWDLRSVEPIMTARGTQEALPPTQTDYAVFSSDGQRVLLLPSQQILDTATLEEKVVLRSLISWHSCGGWSASRRRVAVAGGEEIEVWELGYDEMVVGAPLNLKGHRHLIHHVSFSDDEQFLISASSDRTARVWHVVTGQQVHALEHQAEVNSALFSHDGTQIVSSCRGIFDTGGTVHVWNAQTGEQLYTGRIDTNIAFNFFTPDDLHLVTSEWNSNTVTILNARTHQVEHKHTGYRYWNTLSDGSSYALSADGWVCRFTRLDDAPQQFVWIPPQYRPTLEDHHLGGALSTNSSLGIQVCLPRKDGLSSLLIPRGYHVQTPQIASKSRIASDSLEETESVSANEVKGEIKGDLVNERKEESRSDAENEPLLAQVEPPVSSQEWALPKGHRYDSLNTQEGVGYYPTTESFLTEKGPLGSGQEPYYSRNAKEETSGHWGNELTSESQSVILAAVGALQHLRERIKPIEDTLYRHGIPSNSYALQAGFDESLIREGVGHIELIYVILSNDLPSTHSLLDELSELFHPYPGILQTPKGLERIQVPAEGLQSFDDFVIRNVQRRNTSLLRSSLAAIPQQIISSQASIGYISYTGRSNATGDQPSHSGARESGPSLGQFSSNEDHSKKHDGFSPQRKNGEGKKWGDEDLKFPGEHDDDPHEEANGSPEFYAWFEANADVRGGQSGEVTQNLQVAGRLILSATTTPRDEIRHIHFDQLSFQSESKHSTNVFKQWHAQVVIDTGHQYTETRFHEPKTSKPNPNQEANWLFQLLLFFWFYITRKTARPPSIVARKGLGAAWWRFDIKGLGYAEYPFQSEHLPKAIFVLCRNEDSELFPCDVGIEVNGFWSIGDSAPGRDPLLRNLCHTVVLRLPPNLDRRYGYCASQKWCPGESPALSGDQSGNMSVIKSSYLDKVSQMWNGDAVPIDATSLLRGGDRGEGPII